LQSHESKEQKAENKEQQKQKIHEGSQVFSLSFGLCFPFSTFCSFDFAILMDIGIAGLTSGNSEDEDGFPFVERWRKSPSSVIAKMTMRLGFALWYGLTTLLVQGLHDHRERSEEAAPTAMVGCDDPHPHYAAHKTHELSSGDVDCPACQFRADHQAAISQTLDSVIRCLRSPIEISAPIFRSADLPRATCRAPPLI